MANIFNKFLDSMKLYEDDDEDEDVSEQEDSEEEEEEEKPRKLFRRHSYAAEESEEEAVQPKITRSRGEKNVTPMRPAGRTTIYSLKPTSMEDARDICDRLLSGCAVLINMEGLHVDLAQRIIDFSSGACYSIDGNMEKITSYVFIITPNDVGLYGDFQSLLSSIAADR